MIESNRPEPYRVYIVDHDEKDLYDFIIEAKSLDLAVRAAEAMYDGFGDELIGLVAPERS